MATKRLTAAMVERISPPAKGQVAATRNGDDAAGEEEVVKVTESCTAQ